MPDCFSGSSIQFQGHTGWINQWFESNLSKITRPVAAIKSLRFAFFVGYPSQKSEFFVPAYLTPAHFLSKAPLPPPHWPPGPRPLSSPTEGVPVWISLFRNKTSCVIKQCVRHKCPIKRTWSKHHLSTGRSHLNVPEYSAVVAYLGSFNNRWWRMAMQILPRCGVELGH